MREINHSLHLGRKINKYEMIDQNLKHSSACYLYRM